MENNTSVEIVEPMNELGVQPQAQQDGLFDMSVENIMFLAEKAEKMVTAMNKIMEAAVKITSEHDWVLIGGKPYLQESGATKVARLFGVSWQIGRPEIFCDSEGYKTFTYKGRFEFKGQYIECEGSRSMRDDFFKRKKFDEISERNVRQAAYTNCINNGIKRIIPNLRNIDIKVLENAGLDVNKINGYTFKSGNKGGATNNATGIKCENCDAEVSQKVASFSQSRYGGHIYCMDCQKTVGNGGGKNDGTRN